MAPGGAYGNRELRSEGVRTIKLYKQAEKNSVDRWAKGTAREAVHEILTT
jgi:hypothetical protein